MAKSGKKWDLDIDMLPSQDNTYDLGSSTKRWKVNGRTLGDASEKGVDTSITMDSTSTNVPTTKAVADFLKEERLVISIGGSTIYFTGDTSSISIDGTTLVVD